MGICSLLAPQIYNSPIDLILQNNFVSDKDKSEQTFTALTANLLQNTYNVSIKLSNTTFHKLFNYKVISIKNKNCNNDINNKVFIDRCNFENNDSPLFISLIQITNIVCGMNVSAQNSENLVTFQNTLFRGNKYTESMIKIDHTVEMISDVYGVPPKVLVHIIGCIFRTSGIPVYQFIEFSGAGLQNTKLFIENTNFEESIVCTAIVLSNVSLGFKGLVIFSAIEAALCLLKTDTDITFYNDVEFSNIETDDLIYSTSYSNVNVMEGAHIKIRSNKISSYIFSFHSDRSYLYKSCYFQFYKVSNDLKTTKHTITIEIVSENIRQIFNTNAGSTNCKFNPDSLYYGLNPLHVYSTHFIVQLANSSKRIFPFDTGLLCKCQGAHKNCYTNLLKPIYPGQMLKLHISLNPQMTSDDAIPIAVKVYDNDSPHKICKVSSFLEAEQIVQQNCTEVTYNILSENTQHCKLILYNADHEFPTVFFIKLLNCPAGFMYSAVEKKCICDENLLSELSITICNINDQTILRPANSWLSAVHHNNSYTYHISVYCPFLYCLSYSSHLDLSTSNSQCHFNRSGLLCGHCQQGLSTMFGSLNCQQCANVYLLLIIPIAITGVIFVFLLFPLNLTITDGTINAFILYVNIISINSPIFFTETNEFTLAYTFISLANLDLGIQTCFYNGMDDYAKMWLQLAFPFYLIFIATLIIITSRHSITIQRLTARRALPVLATLFLLSYTKILRIVSSVLFYYSTITHLPNKHTTLVWSIDPTVPLFGVKFTLLFIACLILFLILVPFNIVLLFTRTLSRFRFINRFKPLLDAYQGPYKISYYYYTGIQLLIRAIFFALSSLERNTNLVLGTIILSMIIGIQGIICPLKNKVKNIQEMFYIINLQILYVFALYNHQSISVIAFNVLFSIAAFQFALIIIYHIITYSCYNKFRNKMHLRITTISRWIRRRSKFYNQNQTVIKLCEYHNTRNEIPEAVNYYQYQESLLIEDH